MSRAIIYALEQNLDPNEFREVLVRSTLSSRRPVNDHRRIAAMVANSDLIITARTENGALVGVSRAITDFAFCCYLSDLAVDTAFQGRGIGRALIAETHRCAGSQTTLYLVSAPAAESYYPHIGLSHVPSCWKRAPSP